MFAVDKEKHVSQFVQRQKITLSLSEHKTLNRGHFKASKAECKTKNKQTNKQQQRKQVEIQAL